MSLSGEAARGAATTMMGQLVRFGLYLVSIVVLARILTPDDYGTLSMVMALVGIATIFGDFGLSLASIQAQKLTDAQRTNLFWINAGLGLVLAGLVFLAANPIAAFYDRPELADVTRVLSTVFLINATTAQFRAEVTRKLRFKWLTATDVAAQALSLGFAIAAAGLGLGYWALVAQQISLAVITLVMLTIAAQWLPRLPSRTGEMCSLLTFGANTMGVQVINYASSNVDSVLLGRFWGATSLGFYDRAYQLFRMPLQQIAAPMTRVALPILSKLNGTPRYNAYVERAQLLLSYSLGGAFFLAAALSDPLIEIVLGPQWHASKDIFRILALGGVFQALGYVYYWVFLSKAMTGLQLRFTVFTRILMIGLMAIGVIWGPIGVAVGSSVGLALNWIVLTTMAVPRTGVNAKKLAAITARPLGVYTVMAVLVGVAGYLLPPMNPWPELAILVGIAVVYLGAVVALSKSVRTDARAIIDTVRRLKH